MLIILAQLLQLCKSSGSDPEQVRGQIAVSLMSRDAVHSCPVVLDEGGNFNQTNDAPLAQSQFQQQQPRKKGTSSSRRSAESSLPADFGTAFL